MISDANEAIKAIQQTRGGDERLQAQMGCANGLNPDYRPSLRMQLEKAAFGLDDKKRYTARALDILSRHPEFEEFLELQDLLKNDRLFR